MEVVNSGVCSTIGSWTVSATCKHCKAKLVVGIHDVWQGCWSTGRSRRSGPMFECSECGANNGIALDDNNFKYELCQRIPPDKRAWQMKSGADRVKAPGALLRLRQSPGSASPVSSVLLPSPASRLLDRCMSILEAQFAEPRDMVVVDFATDCGGDALGDFDNEVIEEVVRRLKDKEWLVEVNGGDNARPTALRCSADLNWLRHRGWLKSGLVVGRGDLSEPLTPGWCTSVNG